MGMLSAYLAIHVFACLWKCLCECLDEKSHRSFSKAPWDGYQRVFFRKFQEADSPRAHLCVHVLKCGCQKYRNNFKRRTDCRHLWTLFSAIFAARLFNTYFFTRNLSCPVDWNSLQNIVSFHHKTHNAT